MVRGLSEDQREALVGLRDAGDRGLRLHGSGITKRLRDPLLAKKFLRVDPARGFAYITKKGVAAIAVGPLPEDASVEDVLERFRELGVEGVLDFWAISDKREAVAHWEFGSSPSARAELVLPHTTLEDTVQRMAKAFLVLEAP